MRQHCLSLEGMAALLVGGRLASLCVRDATPHGVNYLALRGGKPVCCVSTRPFLGCAPVEFLRRGLA